MIDHFGTADSLRQNMEIEFQRNGERYQFMKWGMQAFDTFKVVPPALVLFTRSILNIYSVAYAAR